MKSILKNNLFLIVVLLFANTIVAQVTITGIIKDDTGILLPGVNVYLEGTTIGTATDFNGNYSISNVDEGSYTLKAVSLGYTKFQKDIIVAEKDINLNIILNEDVGTLNEVIVTGVANPKSKLESSVSITTLKPKIIEQSAPRTTAEIFRTIPGIRSESSGGEGNSNIAVRGVPVSSGGSKYVQIQEDGLPVLLFGDIAFGTADIFTRYDRNIGRIEAIRGGSASTLSSNSPGAIINLISKTGKIEGGSIGTTFGVDYESFRTDFDYGTSIGKDLYFHMGGFYRAGESIRDAGFLANNGGQFKLNLTKEFKSGYVRLHAKYLNDRTIAYLPNPIQVTGTNNDPNFENIPNFDANGQTLHTANLTQNVGLGESGERRRSDVRNGMNPISTSIGMEASFDLGDNYKIKNNGRFSFNRGGFNSPFPASVSTASNFLADGFATDNGYSSLAFADGSGPVDGNSLIAPVVLFDTQLNDFNNFMNDIRLTKSFDNLDLTVGYFKGIQNISMSWLWNSYLLEASGDNARLIDAFDAAGNPLSTNGLIGFGATLFGDCCQRSYDTTYNTSAPYLSVALEATEKLNLEGSIRYDRGKVDGSFSGPSTSAVDINNDGIISFPEQTVQSIDLSNPTTVNYEYDYVSYSLGANFKIKDNEAVFARISRGASAKADRILFTGLDFTNSNGINALDFLTQVEIGYKRGFRNGSLNATLFSATTVEEGGFEATSNSIIENDYKSVGIELEGTYRYKNLNLRGGVTYTDAEVDSGDNKGNAPRRQPDFIYNFIPTYNFGKTNQNALSLSFIGQSKAFAQDTNELVLPGFLIINSTVNVGITKKLNANLSINNIFDSLGITESEEGSITEGQVNFLRVRPVPGRSISIALNYNL